VAQQRELPGENLAAVAGGVHRAPLEKAAPVAQAPPPFAHVALDKAGFPRDEAWDIGAIAAFFTMSNRLAEMSSMRPNDEFYVMGACRRTRSK